MAIKNMLEDMGYTGFSNFDLKFTGKEGDFRAFEINLRQGRSNYYVTSCGMNIARLAVEKWDDGKDDCVLNENEHFWHHVPASVAFTYTEDKALVEKAKKLKREGKSSCSLKYDFDLNMNPARAFYVYAQLHRQKKKFKVFYPKTTK
jgi:D-aspartate ligase